MNGQTSSSSVAVVCSRHDDRAPAIQALLESRGVAGAVWYPPRDLDEVDLAVREGRVRTVLFPDTAALLHAVWDEEIAFDQWPAAGTSVECLDRAGGKAGIEIDVVVTSWQSWRRTQQRRQVIAGVVLSATAIAAAFVLMACVP